MEPVKNPTTVEQSTTRNKIACYLKNLSPELLGVRSCQNVEVLELTHGAYNLNYRVRVDGQDFLFRLNIEQQSGLAEQIEYEAQAIRFLSTYNISPKCYYSDSTKTYFEFGILIEEYLHGPYISLVPEEMPEIAELMVRLHSLKPVELPLPLITWDDPLVNNLNQVKRDLAEYESKKTPDRKTIELTKKFLERIWPSVHSNRSLYQPDGINHTDCAIDNFIHTAQGLRMIDWEKPRLDDVSYDVSCFLCEPCQLWCTPLMLSAQGREAFLEHYLRLSQHDPELFCRKVELRIPLVSMHWILWAANRLCDVRDNLMAAELQEVHEPKIIRWERTADIRNIEKLLEVD
jgi:thiamine kinase-like enzyme